MAGRQIKTPGVTETTQQPVDQTENQTAETSVVSKPVQEVNQSTSETSSPTNEELMAEIEKLKAQLVGQPKASIQTATPASTGTRVAKLTDEGWTTVEG